MLTYQIRRRLFRHAPDAVLSVPGPCAVRFHFQPSQSFGTATEGRTPTRAKKASVIFDSNTGRHWVTSAEPLKPLEVIIEEVPSEGSAETRHARVELKGSTLEVRREMQSLEELEEFITGMFFVLPPLIGIKFAEPPVITRVDGEVNGVAFRWELANWSMHFSPTTQGEQEERFAAAWDRLPLLSGLGPRRLIAAIHYFHVAVRLDRAATIAGEFMSESILNFCKILEVLFPPCGDGRTREAARAGLRLLGYDENAIERLFLPAMALRSCLDVGHVSLAIFDLNQLETVHAYTEVAESAFRELLDRVFVSVAAGTFAVDPCEDLTPSADALEVIDRLKTQLAQRNETET
jgi:hypothetical protein